MYKLKKNVYIVNNIYFKIILILLQEVVNGIITSIGTLKF